MVSDKTIVILNLPENLPSQLAQVKLMYVGAALGWVPRDPVNPWISITSTSEPMDFENLDLKTLKFKRKFIH